MQEAFPGNGRMLLSHAVRGFLRGAFTHILTPSVYPVALLIDGDNHAGMPAELLANILVEAGKLGGVIIRRVYGNWRAPTMDRWKDLSHHYALDPVHYSSTTANGKNSADIALALDALDLYRCQGITHFCLVASDSDYVPLIRRLRANGCVVVLLGKATSSPALKASTFFIDLDNLAFISSKDLKKSAQQAAPAPISVSVPSISDSVPSIPVPAPVKSVPTESAPEPEKPDKALRILLLKAYEQAAKGKKDGWVSIQGFHAALLKNDSTFKLSDYHYKTFAALFQEHADIFETRKQSSGHLALKKSVDH